MNFDEYQEKAKSTAVYPKEYNVIYPMIALVGELGELFNKYSKTIRGDYQEITDELIKDFEAEAGDVLWNLAVMLDDMGISFQTVAENNIIKLASRKDRGVLKGKGDLR